MERHGDREREGPVVEGVYGEEHERHRCQAGEGELQGLEAEARVLRFSGRGFSGSWCGCGGMVFGTALELGGQDEEGDEGELCDCDEEAGVGFVSVGVSIGLDGREGAEGMEKTEVRDKQMMNVLDDRFKSEDLTSVDPSAFVVSAGLARGGGRNLRWSSSPRR